MLSTFLPQPNVTLGKLINNKLGSFAMSTDLSNVRMKGEDLFMFKSRVKCHKMENLTWASSRIL